MEPLRTGADKQLIRQSGEVALAKIVALAEEEYTKHHLACNMKRECWSDCAECFANDFKRRLVNEL